MATPSMQSIPPTILSDGRCWRDMISRLERRYREMDRAYADVAGQYGFRCRGCEDNCCLTRFHHHTLLEVLYLAEGWRTLAPAVRQTMVNRAITVETEVADAARHGNPIQRMCPLNQDGRCRLYHYRPMICRLHGIPHELRRPGGEVMRQPGCDAFFEQCRNRGQTAYIPFDRTPHYRNMALLEKELRAKTEYTARIKLTIAQILTIFAEPPHEID